MGAIYIPKKVNEIDFEVRNYVKEAQTKKVNNVFLRLSEGVYNVGSLRIHLKMSKRNGNTLNDTISKKKI